MATAQPAQLKTQQWRGSRHLLFKCDGGRAESDNRQEVIFHGEGVAVGRLEKSACPRTSHPGTVEERARGSERERTNVQPRLVIESGVGDTLVEERKKTSIDACRFDHKKKTKKKKVRDWGECAGQVSASPVREPEPRARTSCKGGGTRNRRSRYQTRRRKENGRGVGGGRWGGVETLPHPLALQEGGERGEKPVREEGGSSTVLSLSHSQKRRD